MLHRSPGTSPSPPPIHPIHLPSQATPSRCDVIVGCEDGLLGCIMGSGAPFGHSGEEAPSNASTSTHPLTHSGDASPGSAAAQAQTLAAAVLERMVRVSIGDAAVLEEEDEAAAASAAAAAAAAAMAAAEAAVAGVFRAIRGHDAAVLCLGVMSYVIALKQAPQPCFAQPLRMQVRWQSRFLVRRRRRPPGLEQVPASPFPCSQCTVARSFFALHQHLHINFCSFPEPAPVCSHTPSLQHPSRTRAGCGTV